MSRPRIFELSGGVWLEMVKLKRERSQQRASGVFTCSFLLGSSVLRSCICSLCPRVTVGFRLFNYTFFIGDFSDSV